MEHLRHDAVLTYRVAAAGSGFLANTLLNWPGKDLTLHNLPSLRCLGVCHQGKVCLQIMIS